MAVDDEGWDEAGSESAVARARGAVEDAAYFIVSARKRPDWASHRPGVELVFYLAVVDYETKVLAHRLMASADDRYVWEKYLALHLHEALEKIPQRISAAIREMRRPGTASKASPEKYEVAARALREALKPIRADKTFMTVLERIRNSVAAHHGDKQDATLDSSIFWMLTSSQGVAEDRSPLKTQILEYAVTLTRAVQDFAHASMR